MAKTTRRYRRSSELGFGEKGYSKNTRLITSGGDFNVKKSGMGFWQSLDVYHELIAMKWLNFMLLITLIFTVVNLFFATLYFLAGEGGISGVQSHGTFDSFMSCFFFSTQTITTVGFGSLSPLSNTVSMIAAVESFVGLLTFAIATGLLFARFSRPRQNIIYSPTAIVAPYRNENGLMFRLANRSKNQLIELEVDMIVSYWDAAHDRRIFERVELERNKINFLSMSWTIVHPIDEQSPIYGWTEERFEECQVEVIVMFKAFDDTYVRPVYDRMSYVSEEIEWGKKFVPAYDRMNDGKMHFKVDKLGQTEDAPLN
ncbi:ion channel [Roseivirga sp.]|uniref:ion channel n=1 Tax=Roseivirga sp. TaxID=1964215 RepID=UPI003B52B414